MPYRATRRVFKAESPKHFAASLAGHGVPVETGQFAGDMRGSLKGDGQVPIWMAV